MTRLLEAVVVLIAVSLLSGCGTLINRFEDKYNTHPEFGPNKLKSDLKFPSNRIYGGVATDIFIIRQESQSTTSTNLPFPLDIPFSLIADTFLLPLTIYEQFASGSLQSAAERGSEDEVTDLLRHGVDINGTDSWGHTPLMSAAWAGHANIVTNLLYQGGKPDVLSSDGKTALTYAAINKHREVVGILLSGHADPNGGSDSTGWSPLQYAANNGGADVAQLLIDKNAEVNARTSMGWTPLISSAMEGHFSVVVLLVKNKANINARSNSGETALLYAACNGHEAIVDVLIHHGADVNVGRELQPPEAQSYKRPVIPRRVDAMLFSPLSCAQHYGHNSIADMLKKAGGR